MSEHTYFVGLMSGTSIDGIDAALVAIDERGHAQLKASHALPYRHEMRQQLLALAQPGGNEIARLGSLDRQLGEAFARAALAVMAAGHVDAADVRAIGSHGQTVRHHPNDPQPFTLQIGDPNTIAEQTGVTVVADFRRRDVAAGGQGAPLAPAFHHAMFGEPATTTAVVNIGGVANVSIIDANDNVTGFDTGPGNSLMDAWIGRCQDQRFDADGHWAATGHVDQSLLKAALTDPYFARSAPKSTGPEHFNLAWLGNLLEPLKPEDVQRTLLEITAVSIAQALESATPKRVAICGGGAQNGILMARLKELLSPAVVITTESLGIHPDWVEAAAFAWFAYRTLAGLPANEPAVTGASGYRVLGAIYPA